MTTITARCHPLLDPILPKPQLAGRALPDWLRDMPSEVDAETLGGAPVRTLKHCPPFIDALAMGVMIPLAADLTIEDGQISWDWDPPILPDSPQTRAPIGLHVPEQASGVPLRLAPGQMVVKFTNFWSLQAPEGWDLLFTHPLNRADLPFQTLSGKVSGDAFGMGNVHFPALWTDPDFSGTLPAGTPVAQVIPVPRGKTELEIAPMSEQEVAENTRIHAALQDAPGHYRKTFRR